VGVGCRGGREVVAAGSSDGADRQTPGDDLGDDRHDVEPAVGSSLQVGGGSSAECASRRGEPIAGETVECRAGEEVVADERAGGLPGSPNTGTPPIVANINGLAGRTATRIQRAVPPVEAARAASTRFTWSWSPTLTPPVVITASHSSTARSTRPLSSSGSSLATPRSTGSAPSAWTRASRPGRLASRMLDGPNAPPATSSPVDITPTRRRGTTRGRSRPMDARTAMCSGFSRVPPLTITSCASWSSPRRRMFAPGVTAFDDRTSPSPATATSSGNTASAPGGTRAPVMIRIASPRPRSPSNELPASDRPTTRQVDLGPA